MELYGGTPSFPLLGKSVRTACSVTVCNRFTQHHVDALDLSVNAVTTMRRVDPEISIENCRKYLGRFRGQSAVQYSDAAFCQRRVTEYDKNHQPKALA